MKEYVLQTKIENLLKQGRTIKWAEKRGVWVDGESHVVVDGAYPTACRNPGAAKEMHEDISRGRSKITILTDVPVEKATKPAKQAPRNVRRPSQAKKLHTPKRKPVSDKPGDAEKRKQSNKQRFYRDDEAKKAPLEPEDYVLPGHEEVTKPAEPETVEIFKDGASLERKESPEKIEVNEVRVKDGEGLFTEKTGEIENPVKGDEAITAEKQENPAAGKDPFQALRDQEEKEAAAADKPASKKKATKKKATKKKATKKTATKKTTTKKTKARAKVDEAASEE